jgi:elongation factor P
MLRLPDLKVGTLIIMEDQPYEILETHHSKMAQGEAVLQSRIKNLITGAVLNKNFFHKDKYEEAEIQKQKVKFLYANRGEFWFCDPKDPGKRFSLKEDIIGSSKNFLKANSIIDSFLFEEKVINIALPVKEDYKVTEAAVGLRGDSAQGATKTVKIESGATVTVPLFINEGDIITVNTETGLYVSRAEKSK